MVKVQPLPRLQDRHPSILLVVRQEDPDIRAARCAGECHIQLAVREDWDPKVDPNPSTRLALRLIDRDQECEVNWELATLQMKRKDHLIFGRGECDAGDKLGLSVEDNLDLQDSA